MISTGLGADAGGRAGSVWWCAVRLVRRFVGRASGCDGVTVTATTRDLGGEGDVGARLGGTTT